MFADGFVEGQVFVLAQRFDLKLERFADRLCSVEAPKGKSVPAKRRDQFAEPGILA